MEVEDGEVEVATPTTTGASKPATDRTHTPEPKPTPPAAAMESKKSEILDRREQIKRENAAKAATSTPSHSAVTPRPDSGRLPNSILDRSSPSLPNRPDAPFPTRDLIDRHPPRHGDRRDLRDPRLPEPRSLERNGPRPNERGRDFSNNDRRGVDQPSRDFGRPNDRSSGTDRERVRPDPPPRWTGDSTRDTHDRANSNPRVDSGRLSREMPPPRPSGPPERAPLDRVSLDRPSDRGPPVNPERLPLVNPERQEIINPARAALISGGKDLQRSDSPRGRERDDTRERGAPRPQSPRRNALEKEHAEPRRDEHRGPPDGYHSPRSRADEVQPPPAGPRNDRPIDRDRNNVHDRSSFQPSQPPRVMDPEHGRLNAGPRQQPDLNFGRLNPVPPQPEIPSGPRDRNSRGNRPLNPNPPPPRRDGRQELPRPPTPEKQPPTGPSSRHPRRSVSGQFDQSTPAMNAPTPPVTTIASAIHPDRLAQLGSAPQTPQPALNVMQGSSPSIHPDRMRAFGSDTPVMPPPPINQMGNNRARPPPPPVMTSGPPSGPKGSQASPIASGVNGFAAPTGPASANERAARAGGGRRQLAGINTMLQQAGQQQVTPDRMNARGRGRISTGIGPETPISGPPTPVIPPPPPGPPPARHETVINPQRADLISGGTPALEEKDKDRNGRRERSGRHSRRSSRSPARERDSKHVVSDDRALRNEYRDRSDRRAGDSERERHRPATPNKELIPSGSRESGRDRDRERERDSGRRDAREREAARDSNDANWTGERGERADRGGERGSERGGRSREIRGEGRGEDRRDSRGNREDGGSGRKRRSDEGAQESRGHEKRVRR